MRKNFTAVLVLNILTNPGSDIISFDESSNNLRITSNYGYDIKGTGTIHIPKPSPGNNITLLCSISMKYGVISSQLIEGANNTAIFMNFFHRTIEIYQAMDNTHQRFILLDNASIHLKKEVFFRNKYISLHSFLL